MMGTLHSKEIKNVPVKHHHRFVQKTKDKNDDKIMTAGILGLGFVFFGQKSFE